MSVECQKSDPPRLEKSALTLVKGPESAIILEKGLCTFIQRGSYIVLVGGDSSKFSCSTAPGWVN